MIVNLSIQALQKQLQSGELKAVEVLIAFQRKVNKILYEMC